MSNGEFLCCLVRFKKMIMNKYLSTHTQYVSTIFILSSNPVPCTEDIERFVGARCITPIIHGGSPEPPALKSERFVEWTHMLLFAIFTEDYEQNSSVTNIIYVYLQFVLCRRFFSEFNRVALDRSAMGAAPDL